MLMAVLSDGALEGADPRERRSSRRRPLSEIPAITGVSVQSLKVDVIDAAAGGLLIESRLPLRPGSRTSVEIGRGDAPLNVGGRVVRSEVAGISSGNIQYRSAIVFDRRLDFMDAVSSAADSSPCTGNLADFVVFFDAALDTEHAPRNGWEV
jgi:hypothetical protein